MQFQPEIISPMKSFDEAMGRVKPEDLLANDRKLADLAHSDVWNGVLKPYLQATIDACRDFGFMENKGWTVEEVGMRAVQAYAAYDTVKNIIAFVENSEEIVKEADKNGEM